MKITICGSIGFYPKMEEIRNELVAHGHKVEMPELALEIPKHLTGGKKVFFKRYIEDNGGIKAFPPGHGIWDVKEDAMRNHFKKIDGAEAILVVNEDKNGIQGYVGGNGLIEIGVAFYTKKKIYILNHVSNELSYKQEILSMKPTTIDGDLSRIK